MSYRLRYRPTHKRVWNFFRALFMQKTPRGPQALMALLALVLLWAFATGTIQNQRARHERTIEFASRAAESANKRYEMIETLNFEITRLKKSLIESAGDIAALNMDHLLLIEERDNLIKILKLEREYQAKKQKELEWYRLMNKKWQKAHSDEMKLRFDYRNKLDQCEYDADGFF